MNKLVFEQCNEKILGEIKLRIELLVPAEQHLFLEEDLFQEEFLLLTKEELLSEIPAIIEYQSNLASKISELGNGFSFKWECDVDDSYRTFNFFELDLCVERKNVPGRALYSAHVILEEGSKYCYWEVINEIDAIEAARQLFEL